VRRVAAFVVGAVALGGFAATGADAAPIPARSYIFRDEFSGTGPPNRAKWWSTRTCSTSPDDQYGCYNPANVYRDGAGHLVLRVSAGTLGRPYDFARVQTFREGQWPPRKAFSHLAAPMHVEARIKFSAGAGMWGAFWFNSNTSVASNLELDVQEFRGAAPTQVVCSTHLMRSWSAVIETDFDGAAAYHVYWMNYYRHRVVFGVDGMTCGTTALPAGPPEMIRLSHLVGVPATWGGLGGPPPASAIPALMLVDYVRAWRLGRPASKGTGHPHCKPPRPSFCARSRGKNKTIVLRRS
jgi:glycosyl hydrolase family 16